MIGAEHNAAEFWEQRYNEQHRTLHSAEDVIAELRADLAALREAAQAVVCHLSLGGRMSRSSPEIIDLDRAVLASADSENRETP